MSYRSKPVVKKFTGRTKLVVAFDIPENRNKLRHHFRRQLIAWDFRPVQKSVLESDRDYRHQLSQLISDLELVDNVEIYKTK